jgi:hypothetical protein
MFHSLLPLVIIIVIFLVIAAVIKTVLAKHAQEPQSFPYEKERVLFSPAERSFLGVLEQAVNGRYRFMGKVRLADVVRVKGGMNRSAWQNAFNRIRGKHVDIMACDPLTLSIQFVVELDDSTHGQSRRQTRDQFVDNVLRTVGIPVVHFIVKRSYSVQNIQGTLLEVGVLAKT